MIRSVGPRGGREAAGRPGASHCRRAGICCPSLPVHYELRISIAGERETVWGNGQCRHWIGPALWVGSEGVWNKNFQDTGGGSLRPARVLMSSTRTSSEATCVIMMMSS